MGTLLNIYIFGGIGFYIILWLRSSYQTMLTNDKTSKWNARASLAFPIWPLIFFGIVIYIIYKTIRKLITLSEF